MDLLLMQDFSAGWVMQISQCWRISLYNTYVVIPCPQIIFINITHLIRKVFKYWGAVKCRVADTSFPKSYFCSKAKIYTVSHFPWIARLIQNYAIYSFVRRVHFGNNICHISCLNNHSLSVILPSKKRYCMGGEKGKMGSSTQSHKCFSWTQPLYFRMLNKCFPFHHIEH